jgi:hypothetical protein
MAADADVPMRKLPPLNVRPFQAQDVNQIRQLIADSKIFSYIFL